MHGPLSSSVVVCTMDRPDALLKCLRSIAAQTVCPEEVVVVHAGRDEQVEAKLRRDLKDARFRLLYVRSRASLVVQRNLGLTRSSGDVVFFLDDDVVLESRYFERVLAVYQADTSERVGGVQGSLLGSVDLPSAGLRRLFGMTRGGPRGYLQRTGFPCQSFAVTEPTDVELFSGCMMSFRRRLLERHQFDEALSVYWWGDDWDLSYRVSREARLVQIPDALLVHEEAAAGRDRERRGWRMMVVNHRYLYRKHLRARGQSWWPWLWGEAGFLTLALLRALSGRGLGAARGMLEGFVEVAHGQSITGGGGGGAVGSAA